jgi:hypothetical protein
MRAWAPLVGLAALLLLRCASFDEAPGSTPSDGGALFDSATAVCSTVLPPGVGPIDVPAEAVSCGGRGVYLRIDPDNCGACGRSCRERSCANGMCVPTTAASLTGFQGPVMPVAADDTAFYVRGFAPGSPVLTAWAVPRTGGAPRLIGPSDRYVHFLLLDGRTVLLGHDVSGGVALVWYLEGGESRPLTTLLFAPSGVARSREQIFLTDHASGTVLAVETVDGRINDLAPPQAAPFEIVADERAVAWLNMPFTIPDAPYQPGQLIRVALPDRGVSSSAPLGKPSGLGRDAEAYYFYEAESGEMRRIPIAGLEGSSGVAIARWTKDRYAYGATVYGDFVYFAFDEANQIGEIVRVPRCGGTPLRVATPLAPPSIVVDGDSIVWGVQGELKRLSL